jgi:hypothetical protein
MVPATSTEQGAPARSELGTVRKLPIAMMRSTPAALEERSNFQQQFRSGLGNSLVAGSFRLVLVPSRLKEQRS